MDKDYVIIAIIGMGMVFGLLGFLAYLASAQRKETVITQVPQQLAPLQESMDNGRQPVETEEIRPTRPHIINHVLNTANTWYEIPIPKDIKTWSMNARGEYDIYYAFEPSHATYRTLFRGMFLDSDTAPNSISTIYVSSGTANAIVELILFR